MKFIKHSFFFMQQHYKQMKNKWLSLILLFIIPLLMLLTIVGFVTTLLSPFENSEVKLAIIDEDQTEESELIVQLFLLTIADQEPFSFETMTRAEAELALRNNELTSYIVFPKNLTADLFSGEPVKLQQFGNKHQFYESLMIRELITNLARYIESSQANILTAYDYAKKVGMPSEEYEKYRMEQFMSFAMNALSKGSLISENEIVNNISSSPMQYFAVAALFILLTIWLVGLELLLAKEVPDAMQLRYLLLGVTEVPKFIARSFIVIITALIFVSVAFVPAQLLLNFELYTIDYVRIISFILFYSFTYLLITNCLLLFISSMKIALLIHSTIIFFSLLLSGAIIPSLYLPFLWQEKLHYFFGHDTFSSLIELTVEQRNYADYTNIVASCVIAIMIFVSLAKWKERFSK